MGMQIMRERSKIIPFKNLFRQTKFEKSKETNELRNHTTFKIHIFKKMKQENIPTGAAKSSAGGGRGLRPGLSGTAAMRKKKKRLD